MMKNKFDRRKFLGTIPAIAAAGSLLTGQSCKSNKQETQTLHGAMPDSISFEPIENVRIGFVGLGVRGSNHIRKLRDIPGCQIVCVCDIVPEKVKKIQKWIVDKGFPEPKGYSKDEVDYRRMCENEDFDLLITATPWELHAPICITGMKNGKHTATEVPGCTTIDASWELVEASEKYSKHCILLENYCYFQEILAIDNMVRKGLFGNPLHVYAGYQKEAMYYQMTSDGKLTFSGEGHNNAYGNVYPTHHAGPSAKWMNVNRGDNFDYLVSMGCGNVAFNQYAKERFGPDHPLATRKFNMADISNTMIMTKEGRTLHLILDTILPRPGRHYFRLQAERGIYENIERRLHIHNLSPGKYTGLEENPYANKRMWESLDNYLDEYDHPIWKKFHEDNIYESGHAGADFVIMRRLVNLFNIGAYPDIDVYDLAAWSCLVELTEISARNGSKPVEIPDFTRGKWKTREPLPIVL
jgi:hypothetical protein